MVSHARSDQRQGASPLDTGNATNRHENPRPENEPQSAFARHGPSAEVKMKPLSLWLAFVFSGLVLFSRVGSAQAPYYAGKTMTVVEGNSPGGVADLRTKTIVQFLQKYIPGSPTIVSQYVPGGGGRQAANQVYRAAGDGLTIGASSPGVLSSAVLGEPGVEYDPFKFIYLGSPFSENNNMFVTRKALGLNSLEKLRAVSGLRIGAQSVGHVQYIRGRLFAWLLDLKDPRFVVGYSGTELDIALERGEVDARAAALDTRVLAESYNNLVNFHAILEIPKGHRPPQFAHLPEIEAFVRSGLESRLMAMARIFWGVGTLKYLPPSTPEKLAEILRQAVRETFKDRQFHEQYKKVIGFYPTPLMPEAQQKLVAALPRDNEVIKLFKAISGIDPLPPRK
jgi:tripartite-type tricarboxylate transporter receptor subunit TctC